MISLDVNNGVYTMDMWICLDDTGPVFSWQGVRDQVYIDCLGDILVRSGSCHPAGHLYMVGCCASSCTHIKPFG